MNKDDDKLISIIRDKLESHKIPFDTEQGWSEMESRLKKSNLKLNNKKHKLYWLYSSGVAAAIMLLCMLVTNNNECIEEQIVDDITIISKPKTDDPFIADNYDTDVNTDLPINNIESVRSIKPNNSFISENKTKGETANVENVEQNGNTRIESVEGTQEEGVDIMDLIAAKEIGDYYLRDLYDKDFSSDKPVKEKSKKTNWQLGVGVKGAGGNNKDNSNAVPTAYSLFTKTADKRVETDNKEKHNVPLSFGVKVKKKITDRWALQTGINYTYLHSSFKSDYDGLNTISRTQDLHYLGVPVAASYSFINKQKWEVYALAGVTVEKGLAKVLKEKGISKNSKINGVQFSLNSAIGIQYNISKNLNFYLDPSVSYYIDNNQPSSARTRASLTFELSAGLGINL